MLMNPGLISNLVVRVTEARNVDRFFAMPQTNGATWLLATEGLCENESRRERLLNNAYRYFSTELQFEYYST